MTLAEYFYRFGLALGIGLLIGVQREAVADASEGKLSAGARTFALISLAGYVLALACEQAASGLPFLGGLLVLGVFLALGYRDDLAAGKPGMTTEMAIVVVYGIGGLAFWGHIQLAAALGVAVTALLSLKNEFRSFTQAVTREDIYAIVKFAAISVIVLPILPNRAYGPAALQVFNPYKIWLMVVFVSGISFLGYVLIKVIGARRGIGLMGLLGGLASSTAVTLSLSHRSRENDKLSRSFALAILLAWVVMFGRVLLLVLALDPELVASLVLPMGISGVIGAVYCVYLYFVNVSSETVAVEFSNPFELGPAIRFGAIYGAVLLVSRAAQVYFGDLGVYISSFVSGLLDVDVIALSMVELLQQDQAVALDVATRATVIAAMANTLFKGIFALSVGGPRLRRYLWPGLALMLVAGTGAAFLI